MQIRMNVTSLYKKSLLILFLFIISSKSQNFQFYESYPSNLQNFQQTSTNTVQLPQPSTVPYIACPNYFQYVQYGSEYIGKLILPTVSSDIELVVHLSQRQPLTTNYYGKISLFDDRESTLSRIQHGQPITYKIEFPSQNELPKLTKISVNGQDICIADEYPRPSTRLFLNHKLQSITQTRTTVIQPNSPTNNVAQPQQFLGNNLYEMLLQNGFQMNTAAAQPVRSTPAQPQTVIRQSYRPQQSPALASQSSSRFPVQPTTSSRINVQQHTAVSTVSAQCGQENSVSAFIYGGEEIMRGQFPWLTAIYSKSSGLKFLCGGSLISSRTVISAAHCFRLTSLTADRLVVNLGRHNLEDYSEQGLVIRELQNLIIHPEYSSNVFPDADLAILQMRKAVEYTVNIRPICLWTESVETNLIVGQTGTVAGWGADETGRTFTPIPKKVNTNIVSDGECLRSSEAYSMLTSPRTFCAGNRDGSGPCMGDSGSGLMINRNGRWFLRGIVSAGQTKQQKCNLLEYVVFCDAAKHLQWIQNNMLA